MITKVHIENFKPFSGADIDLAPLTILFGPNGSGKSSVLQALAVLSQSSDPRWGSRSEWYLQGYLVSFKHNDWAYHKRDTKRPLALGVEIEIESSLLEGITLEHVVEATRGASTSLSYLYSYCMDPRSSFQEMRLGGSVLFLSEEKTVKKGRWESAWVTRADFPPVNPSDEFKKNSFSFFLSADQFRNRFQGTNDFRENQNVSQIVNLCAFLMDEMRKRLYENVYYVTAQRNLFHFRGQEQQGSLERDERSRSVGSRGEKAVDTLSLMAGPRGDPRAIEKIKEWLEKFGLPEFVAGLAVQPGSGALTDASYSDPDFGLAFSLPMAGFGSVQMVPVIAQLFCAPEGSTVMIEEPEISLHPGAQVLLPALFIDAVKSGRQVIVSTHSQTLVTALRHSVRKKLISNAEIALYDMTKSAAGAAARKVTMSEDGVLADWIPSFAEVEDKMFEEWQEEEE